MRARSFFALAAICAALAATPAIAASKPVAHPAAGMFKGISKAAMIAAAKAAPLKLIDYLETYCDGDTSISAWLTQLTAGEAKSITWSAGGCELTNDLNPLDSGGDYCVDADVRLKHPKNRQDQATIEISLDDPKHGRPGPAYAFRDMFDDGSGMDYERERRIFQLEWRTRFKGAPPPPCENDQ